MRTNRAAPPGDDTKVATIPSDGDTFPPDISGKVTPSSELIALVSAYFPAQGGGIELVCADLVSGLCRLGKKINWLALRGDTTGVHAACAVTPLPGNNTIYRKSGIPFPLPSPKSLQLIWKVVRDCSIVVVAEANFAVSCLAFAAAKLQKKPVLLIQHVGAPSTVSASATALMRVAERLAVRPMLRSADTIVYVSPVVARHFADVRTRRAAQVIGHGVDVALFAPASSDADKSKARNRFGLQPGRPIACFVGRCTTSKGIDTFVRMARLRPDWQFVVAGTGPIDPASHGLANLKALGHIERSALADLYKASDVLVLPSRSESFSLVVREALAAGLKVLSSDQILETDPALATLLLTRPVDLQHSEATAQSFAAALGEPAPCSMSEARAYVVENCSWPRIIDEYAALIAQLQRGSEP